MEGGRKLDVIVLVNKAKKGDERAFAQLIEWKKDKIYKIAFSYVKNKEDALDIVSEAVCKAYISIGTVKKSEYFYTWLTRIVINTAINFSKKKERESFFDENYHIEKEGEDLSIEDNIVDNLDLYNAIDQLKEPYKSVIILKYFEDFTINQVAEILEKPVGTIKTHLNKALNILRSNFREVQKVD